ncbi:hypothetical protein ACIBEA_22215 [Streptomyces sp. NPDC051555]
MEDLSSVAGPAEEPVVCSIRGWWYTALGAAVLAAPVLARHLVVQGRG